MFGGINEMGPVDARGEVVRVFSGEKDPREAIVWDGRDIGGAPAIPGLTYSYVFTARDRAGNRKRFVGEGFEVRALHGDWSAASGDKAVMSWLRLKSAEAFQPDLVAAQNDLMALGARRAFTVNRPDWAQIPFLGCDGLPEGGQRHVNEGAFAATVITPSNTGPALEWVARWLDHGELPPREVIMSPTSYPPVAEIPEPGAILVVSAHWEAPLATVSAAAWPGPPSPPPVTAS